MPHHPFDDLAIQLPGRLMALEIWVTDLLATDRQGVDRLELAESALSIVEGRVLSITPPAGQEATLQQFAAAREQLDKTRREVLRARGGPGA